MKSSTFEEIRNRIQQNHIQRFPPQNANGFRQNHNAEKSDYDYPATSRARSKPRQGVALRNDRAQSDSCGLGDCCYNNSAHQTSISRPHLGEQVCGKTCQKKSGDENNMKPLPFRTRIEMPSKQENILPPQDVSVAPVESEEFRRIIKEKFVKNNQRRIDEIAKSPLRKAYTTKDPSVEELDKYTEEGASSPQYGRKLIISNPLPKNSPPPIRPPQFRPLACQSPKFSRRKIETLDEEPGGNLGTAMKSFKATIKALESDLHRKSQHVHESAVDVISGKINDSKQETSTGNTRDFQNISEPKTAEEVFNFKLDKKSLNNIVTLLNKYSCATTSGDDIKNLELLENSIEGQVGLSINIEVKTKETERQPRNLYSSIRPNSELSDGSYVTVNSSPSHRNDRDTYIDLSGDRRSVTKVIIEKEFNMPDEKNNGTRSFKIGSKTYYDEDMNPRIEKIYYSVPGENTKPKYQYVVEELLNTEYSYLMGLNHMYNDYVLYFRKKPNRRITHMNVLFTIIEDLYKSQSVFYNCLNEHINNVDELINCFIVNEKLFHLYENYILTINIMKKPLECMECQADITNRQRQLGTPLSFQNYMLSPLQRITRYLLLLEKLKSELKPEGFTCNDLVDVINFLKTLVQSTEIDIEIIQSIKNIPDNITRFGRFIMKHIFNLKRRSSQMKSMVFLFQELIIFTVEIDSATYMYKGSVNMNNVYIRAIAEKPLCFELLDFNNLGGPNFTFQDTTNSQYQKNLYILEACHSNIKDVWVEVIESLLWEQLMFQKKNRLEENVRERLV